MATTEAATSPADVLRNITPAQRMQFLHEAVKLCFADGSLDAPLRVTEENDLFTGYVVAMWPRTKTPFPKLTNEEEAELQRRIDDRKNAMSHVEFVARVRQLICEHRKSD